MWEPRSLTTLWDSTTCYRGSFTSFTYFVLMLSPRVISSLGRDSSICIVAGIWAEQERNQDSTTGRSQRFPSSLQCPAQPPIHWALQALNPGQCGWNLKLTSSLQLTLRLGMDVASIHNTSTPPHSYMTRYSSKQKYIHLYWIWSTHKGY
jgi:hypothetical protein